MGKIKPQQNQSKQTSPICENTPIFEPKAIIETILTQLRDPAQREKAAVYVANLRPVGELVQEIISSKLLQALGFLLLDCSPNVPFFVAGALRKMSDKHPSILEAMVDQGVMNPLCSLFKMHYDDSWKPSKIICRVSTTFNKLRYDNKTALFIEATSLLRNLFETTPKAVEIFNQAEVLPILAKHIDDKYHDSKISTSVVRLLYSLTDNNPEVNNYLGNSSIQSDIHRIVIDESAPLLFKAAGIGILNNISKKDETYDVELIKILLNILELDFGPQLGSLTKAVIALKTRRNGDDDDEAKENKEFGNTVFEEEENHLEEESDKILDIILAKQISLEVLNNVCYIEEKSEDEWVDEEEEDISQECAKDAITDMDIDVSSQESSSPLHDTLKKRNILTIALRHSASLPAEFVPHLQSYESLYQNLCQVRKTALLAIPNLLEIGGDENFTDIWRSITQILHDNSEEYLQDVELLVAFLSAIRAVLPQALLQNSSLLNQFSESDLQMLFNFAKSPGIENLRVVDIIVNLLGGIGSTFTSNSSPSDFYNITKSITEFLLMIAHQAPSLAVLAECLNSLIDIFSNDSTHSLAAELCLPDKLVELQKTFRKQLKEKKREAKEHAVLISTIKDNLSRFINYKKQYCK